MYRKLHRSIGIGSFIFLIFFVITGLTIQHTSWFDLDQRYVSASLAKFLYGTVVRETIDYKTDSHWVSQAGNFLYIDGVLVSYIELNNLQGVAEDKNYIWIVGDNKLWMLSKQGEIADEFSVLNGLPAIVNKVGYNQSGAIVVGSLRNNWLVNENIRDWQIYHDEQIRWTTPVVASEVPIHLKETVLAHANDHLVNWERVLLDFHSGRLFGTAGIVIVDIVALLLLFLSATGIFLWLRRT